jgi:hypothetical protein
MMVVVGGKWSEIDLNLGNFLAKIGKCLEKI